jgi:nicotinate-nucleotide adenylyltransferase
VTRIGIYGGTFNPIHVGHLRAAEEVAEALDLARVLFVPSATPPHKPDDPADAIAPAAERLAWVRLAVADNPRFAAEPIEVDRGGASFLVDTLRALRARLHAALPGVELVFLVGSDAFAEMGTWRAPRELLALASYAVMVRPPLRAGRLGDWLPAALRDDVLLAADGRSGRHRSAGTRLWLVEIDGFDVSASAVRQRLRQGRSVRYLLPEPVRQEILLGGAYGSGTRAPAGPAEPAGPGTDPGAELQPDPESAHHGG